MCAAALASAPTSPSLTIFKNAEDIQPLQILLERIGHDNVVLSEAVERVASLWKGAGAAVRVRSRYKSSSSSVKAGFSTSFLFIFKFSESNDAIHFSVVFLSRFKRSSYHFLFLTYF